MLSLIADDMDLAVRLRGFEKKGWIIVYVRGELTRRGSTPKHLFGFEREY